MTMLISINGLTVTLFFRASFFLISLDVRTEANREAQALPFHCRLGEK